MRGLLLLVLIQSCRCGAPPTSALKLEAEPKTIDFGDVAVGSMTVKSFTLRSRGEPVSVSIAVDRGFGNPEGFSSVLLGPVAVDPDHATTVTWRFAPPQNAVPGPRSARLVLTAEQVGAEVFLTARVTGSGAGGGVSGGRTAGGTPGGGASGGSVGGAGGLAGGAGGGLNAGGAAGGEVGGGTSGGLASGGSAGGASGGFSAGGLAAGGVAGGSSGGFVVGGGSSGGSSGGGFVTGGGMAGGSALCAGSCTNWTQCTTPGTGCDLGRGCCVPCGGLNQPCCVDFSAGQFRCGGTLVCGRSSGTGSSVGYYCCANAGDGCCQQGGCSGSTCCKCPRNGLNFCVQPSFGCGGC